MKVFGKCAICEKEWHDKVDLEAVKAEAVVISDVREYAYDGTVKHKVGKSKWADQYEVEGEASRLICKSHIV